MMNKKTHGSIIRHQAMDSYIVCWWLVFFFWDAYIEVVKYLGIWESQELWFELGGWRNRFLFAFVTTEHSNNDDCSF